MPVIFSLRTLYGQPLLCDRRHVREGVEEGKGRAYAEHGEEERALQTEERCQEADDDGAQDETRIAANGKEAHSRAFAVS